MATFGFVPVSELASAQKQVTNPRGLAGLFRKPSPFTDASEWQLEAATLGTRDGLPTDRAVFLLKQGDRTEVLWLTALTRLNVDVRTGEELVSIGSFVQLCRDLAESGKFASELELAQEVCKQVQRVKFSRIRRYNYYDFYQNVKVNTMVDANIVAAEPADDNKPTEA